jgi:hypothetical protein
VDERAAERVRHPAKAVLLNMKDNKRGISTPSRFSLTSSNSQQSRPSGIQMNLTHHVKTAAVFLFLDGLIVVLKQVAMAAMAAVVAYGLAGHQPVHGRVLEGIPGG